jgi:hypothetical protein
MAEDTSFVESDPTGKVLGDPGAKVDAGKCRAGVLDAFPRALAAVAAIGEFGLQKGYGRDSWLEVENGAQRYRDAFWRHLLQEQTEGLDLQSGLPHRWHTLWNLMASLELELKDQEEKA